MLTALVFASKPAPAEEIDWPRTVGALLAIGLAVLLVGVVVGIWKWVASAERKRLANIEAERVAQQQQAAYAWQVQQARQEQERQRLEAQRGEQQAREERERQAALALAEQDRLRREAQWRERQAREERERQAALAMAEQERLAAVAAREAAERARAAEQQRRIDDLTARYGAEVAEKIIAGSIWVGQTAQMLVEALGRPADVEEKVMKTKTKRVYKYQHQGANRYGLRVTMDNDVVVGWDQK
jgi:hypothetical protein